MFLKDNLDDEFSINEQVKEIKTSNEKIIEQNKEINSLTDLPRQMYFLELLILTSIVSR